MTFVKGSVPDYSPYNFLKLILVAFVAGYLSIWLSFHYEFYDKLVSWYFPHAVRLAALFLLPFRQWCLFLFVTIIGSDAYYHINIPNEEGITINALLSFGQYYVMELAAGGVVAFIFKRYVDDWFTLNSVGLIILLSVLYRFLYLFIPACFELGFFIYMPQERYFEFVLAIQISGYLVGFYAITLVYLYKWIRLYENKNILIKYREFFVCLVMLLLFVTVLYQIEPNLEYLLRIVILIPLILAAVKYGWFAGMICGTVIVSFLFVFLFNQSGEILIAYQPFIIMYLLISLIISVVIHENDIVNQKHHKTQLALKNKNQHLSDTTKKVRSLSSKIINIQEEERKYLSKELHDEIGQNIIALKSSIYLLENSNKANKVDEFRRLKEDADMIYSSVYELMHWLRPATLDKFGLYETLKGDFFREKLALSDIEYDVDIFTDKNLDEHVETAIFRICQEAVNNTLKHSDATEFTIHISDDDSLLSVQIADNGSIKNKPSMHHGGFGLEGIYERVKTLGGECHFKRVDGFAIDICIPC